MTNCIKSSNFLKFKPGLDWKEVKMKPDDILDPAEKIGAANDMKFDLKT